MKGLGIDIVDITAFAELVGDRDSSFVRSTFTNAELEYAFGNVSANPNQHLAVRYAAKEAVIKALDQARKFFPAMDGGLMYNDIEIISDSFGRPSIEFRSKIKTFVENIGINEVKLSLSHDGNYAAAVVVLE